MSEAKYQRKIIKHLEKEGWYVLKLMKTNKNGIPDLLALKKDEVPKFIEAKSEKGKPSPLQEFRIKELRNLGFNADVKYEGTD